MKFTKFTMDDAEFADYGEGPGSASIARLVTAADSRTMGAYFARFDGRSVEWTVRYDELILCMEGVFTLLTEQGTTTLHPGEALWIPEGTALTYAGDKAVVFITIAPVDWRSRQETQTEGTKQS